MVKSIMVAGEIISGLVLALSLEVAIPFIVLESFATTDNKTDFVVTLGTKTVGLAAGKFVRGKLGIDRRVTQALRDPRYAASLAIAAFST